MQAIYKLFAFFDHVYYSAITQPTGVNDMNMLCGNTQAEIDNDTMTDEKENLFERLDHARWRMYFEALIAGAAIEKNGRTYRLSDRMIDEYQEFADKFDDGIDFMAEFIGGQYGENLNNVFKSEARTLASYIVG